MSMSCLQNNGNKIKLRGMLRKIERIAGELERKARWTAWKTYKDRKSGNKNPSRISKSTSMKGRQHKALEAQPGKWVFRFFALFLLQLFCEEIPGFGKTKHVYNMYTDLYISKHTTRHFTTALFYSLPKLVPMMSTEINGSISIFRDIDKTRILPRSFYFKIADWQQIWKPPA